MRGLVSPQLFNANKPIFGMVHLSGDAADRLQIAREEVAIMAGEGMDGIIVENYFGDKNDVRHVLEWVCAKQADVLVGLNVLDDNDIAFDLANEFQVDFIQVDSVCGHMTAADDVAFEADLATRRAAYNGKLLGGVRFKYQPVNSGRAEHEDVLLGAGRADALVVTGEGTGVETDLAKLLRFRAALGADYPLFIGAGLTAANARAQLAYADGAIVGSYLKDTFKDTGRVCKVHVRHLMDIVEDVRLVPKTCSAATVAT